MSSQLLLLLLVRRAAVVLAGERAADAVAAGAAAERAARVERRMAPVAKRGARVLAVAVERAEVAAERAAEAVERAAVTTVLPGGIMTGMMALAAGECFYCVVLRMMIECDIIFIAAVTRSRSEEVPAGATGVLPLMMRRREYPIPRSSCR